MKFQYARLSKEAFAARAEVKGNSEQGIVKSLSESLEASQRVHVNGSQENLENKALLKMKTMKKSQYF
jgi:hypothetical protein